MRELWRTIVKGWQQRSREAKKRRRPDLEMLENRLTPSSGSSTAVPLGAAFPVNTTTVGNQFEPAVARDTDGDFVIVWRGPDANNSGVFGQRFNAAGEPQGGEFPVNQFTANDQALASVGMDAQGNFTIAWTSNFQITGWDSILRRYAADGTPLTNEVIVPSLTDSHEWNSDVAVAADSRSVVAWTRSTGGFAQEIAAKRYDANLVAQPTQSAPGQFVAPDGLEARVNTLRPGNQVVPEVAIAADGSFAVIWIDLDGQHDGSGSGVFGQLYNADGTRRGSEFRVNTFTQGDQTGGYPTNGIGLAMDPAGNFVVTWQSPNQDGSGLGIFAQRFSSSGARIGEEFQVNTITAGNQRGASLAMDADGDFVIAWETDNGIFYRRYNTDGVAQDSADVQVSTSGFQSAVAMDADGDFVVSWFGTDGMGDGILARLYDWSEGAVVELEVQQGQSQRSFIRYLDLTFTDSSLPQQLLDQGRIQLTQFGLDGSGPGIAIALDGLLGVSGSTLGIDFGPLGLGGAPNSRTGDGLYEIGLDLDGNGTFETAIGFHRLFGDVTGDGAVLSDDFLRVSEAFVLAKYDAEGDTNGDGVVDVADVLNVALALHTRMSVVPSGVAFRRT